MGVAATLPGLSQHVSVFALYRTDYNFQRQFSSTLPDLRLWEEMI